jgi:Trypsin-like peptidase domain
MNSSSIVLVSGERPQQFGTGFVIHRSDAATYVVTCTHVISGLTELRVNGRPATVQASDAAKFGFDLAVLRVDELLDVPSIKLNPLGKAGRPFVAAGYSSQDGQFVFQDFRGVLGRPSAFKSLKYGDGQGWQFMLRIGGKLEDGYSGSPIVDETSGDVWGVVTIRAGDTSGRKGIAIAVGALRAIWPDMPVELSENISRSRRSISETLEPVMNLSAETAAFERIVTGHDASSRTIFISGSTGMGKSHLLQIYRHLAEREGLDLLDFGLAQQITVQSCLSRIVGCLQREHFPQFEEHLDSLARLPDVGSPTSQQGLTRFFFKDLADHDYLAPLVIFFDQYEKADPVFRAWISNTFVPQVSHTGPLIVVIAGQDLPAAEIGLSFRLAAYDKRHFYRYAEESGSRIGQDVIDAIHHAFGGRPMELANIVRANITLSDLQRAR